MAAYVVEHLTKRYRRHGPAANDDVSLVVEQGGFFGIFGPNGAGKTTLVRQMAGLLKPTSGQIRLFAQDVVAHPEIVPRYLGYYGQRLAALRFHTFREVVAITGALRGLSRAGARRQADGLIERYGVAALADQRMWKLSGGEQRLAVLLATFMGTPPVLILDEPTNELDPVKRRAVWEYLAEINQADGVTIVLVTHNLLEAERAVERVAVVDQGRIQEIGTPGELKRRVADVVRLEIQLREGASGEAERRLAHVEGSVRLRPGRWEIAAPKDQAADLLPQIVKLVGLEALDDFRLMTPSMEDVYVHVTGRRWEGDTGVRK